MTKATIPLATSFNPGYFKGRVVLMEKYDGVPIRVRLEGGEVAEATTRPGKPLTASVAHLVDAVAEVFGDQFPDREFVMEVQHPEVKTFKDVSGMVRKDEPRPELYGVVFDMSGGEGFLDRLEMLSQTLMRVGDRLFSPATVVLPEMPDNLEGDKLFIQYVSTTPKEYFEGWIVRCADDPYEPNKRQKGYQKLVIEPTVDLKIVGFEEAVSKDGEPLGMVGRLIAEYKGEKIGIGPGKLTHAERRELFTTPFASGRIAEIKYKRDPSYDALRQPTFQHWRDDKDTPNEE